MFEVLKEGIFSRALPPSFGMQDVGVSPAGVMDAFSYDSGNLMLGNKTGTEAFEIIFAPELKFTSDAFFILTGAAFNNTEIVNGGDSLPIEWNRVYRAVKNSVLRFGARDYGFRTYLCCREADSATSRSPEGRTIDVASGLYRWVDGDSKIRVIEGPEHRFLDDEEPFFSSYWKVSRDTNAMGMRLETRGSGLKVKMENMISEAVSNGTVQLTPEGPIVLLKHRQTMGGYPRIFNVISADVDILSQYSPGQIIYFKKVGIPESHRILAEKSTALKEFEKLAQLS